MTDAAARLAAYGTLAPGGSNHGLLADLGGVWTTGTVRGTRLDDGWHGYPGLVLDEQGDPVTVAVLTAAALADAWARIDAFEGPGYRRVVADVRLDDGEVVRAHVYVLASPPRHLAGGRPAAR